VFRRRREAFAVELEARVARAAEEVLRNGLGNAHLLSVIREQADRIDALTAAYTAAVGPVDVASVRQHRAARDYFEIITQRYGERAATQRSKEGRS
jgi:hypothetical protein